MKRILLNLFLFLGLLHHLHAAAEEVPIAGVMRSLNPKDRPADLQSIIDRSFACLSEQRESNWPINGVSKKYETFCCDDFKVIAGIIQDSPDQKEFTFLDVGAGCFAWGQSVAHYLNAEFKDKELKFHLIGVRGEQNPDENIIEDGICTRYELGAFKIEEISTEFLKRDLDVHNKIDGIWTNFTFRHLADPVGTFVQTRDLLRPEKGLFLLDGFFYMLKEDTLEVYSKSQNQYLYMEELFMETGDEFSMLPYTEGRAAHHFILRRSNEGPCAIPFSYHRTQDLGDRDFQCASKTITVFERHMARPEEDALDKITLQDLTELNIPYEMIGGYPYLCLYGSEQNLYEKSLPYGSPKGSKNLLKWIQDKGCWKYSF